MKGFKLLLSSFFALLFLIVINACWGVELDAIEYSTSINKATASFVNQSVSADSTKIPSSFTAKKSSTSSGKTNLSTWSKTVTIGGVIYKGGTSSSGSIWIISKRGKRAKNPGELYKNYVGTRSSQKHNGSYVWHNTKMTKYWICNGSTPSGNPKRTYLTAN